MLKPITTEEMEMLMQSKDNRCSLEAMLKEFVKMNVPYAEVENHTYATARSGVGSIRTAIKRWHLNSLECMCVGDKIVLINHNITA